MQCICKFVFVCCVLKVYCTCMFVLSGVSLGMHLWRCRDRREVYSVYLYIYLYVSSMCYMHSYMFVLSGASLRMHLWRCRDRREVRPTSSFLAPPFLLLNQPSKPDLYKLGCMYIPSFKPAFKTFLFEPDFTFVAFFSL